MLLLHSLVLLGLSTANVNAWGGVGHEIVTTIAQIHLHPTVLPKLCEILNVTASPDRRKPECNIGVFASWADSVRFRMRWSAQMHYVGSVGDHPGDNCQFPSSQGWDNVKINVLKGIRNTSNILANWDGKYDDLSNEAFKFLIHFMGDVHQPLHLTGRDRGGNGIKVAFDGRSTNLHSVWDNFLLAQQVRTLPYNYSRPLPIPEIEYHLRGTIFDNYIRRVMWEGVLGRWKNDLQDWIQCPSQSYSFGTQVQRFFGMYSEDGGLNVDDDVLCPYHWSQPLHKMNCEFIWPAEIDTPEYRSFAYTDSEHDDAHDDLAEFVSEINRTPRKRPATDLFELDTPKYAGKIKKEFVLEELLAKGGIRLAALLNYLFADLDDAEVVRTPFVHRVHL